MTGARSPKRTPISSRRRRRPGWARTTGRRDVRVIVKFSKSGGSRLIASRSGGSRLIASRRGSGWLAMGPRTMCRLCQVKDTGIQRGKEQCEEKKKKKIHHLRLHSTPGARVRLAACHLGSAFAYSDLCHLPWSSVRKSSTSAMFRRYCMSASSSMSSARFAGACLNAETFSPLWARAPVTSRARSANVQTRRSRGGSS